MTVEFRLPDVGEGLGEAELLEWHVAPGDAVAEDQPLADVQTDKAVVVLPCPTTGRVLELRGEPGDTVAVGAVLAVFAAGDGDGAGPAPGPAPDAAESAATPAATAPEAPSATARPLASPAVRRLARERGVDLRAVRGSGPGGRIVREDVEAGAEAADGPAAPAPAPLPPEPGRTLPLRGLRRTIARSLSEAWRTVPHVIDFREVDVTAIAAARARLREHAERSGDPALARALTLTPLLVKIAAVALHRHPYVNASIDMDREEIALHPRAHVGIATATPDGLLVPVVHDAGAKSVAEIAVEAGDLGRLARERRATAAQLSGATFTVNNFGSLGIWLGTPIVKPPQVANLGFGRVDKRPVVVDDEVVVRPVMPLACSGDHRLLDGDVLAAFVSEVVALIEDPLLLLGDLR